ncbi:MAG: phage tail protein [Chloroflexota bacterium]
MTQPPRHQQHSHPFELRIDGLVGYFREVSGLILTPEWTAFEREQPRANQPSDLTQSVWPRVILKDGYSTDQGLWAWQNSDLARQPDTNHHCAIIQYNRQRDIVSTWYLAQIQPDHLFGLRFDVHGPGYKIEEFALNHQGLTRHLPETEPNEIWVT